MAGGVTEFGAGSWLAALLGASPHVAGYWIALCTDEPGVDSDGTILADLEPDGVGYARQYYLADQTHWGVNGAYAVTLTQLDYGVAGSDWGAITHYALTTAASEGDIYAFGEFLSPAFIQAGTRVLIPPGGLVLTISSAQDSIAL